MSNTPIILDIETITPTYQVTPEFISIVNSKMPKKQKGVPGAFEKYCALTPGFGQIVCIGIGSNDNVYTITNTDEKELLTRFWSVIKPNNTRRIVTFNGKSFDVPYIILNSIRHGINISKKLSTRRYYNDAHFDIFEVLTNYYQGEKLSLHAFCHLFNIPVDDQVTGADIRQLYINNDFKTIISHCESDIILTSKLFEKIKGFF